MRVTFVIGWVQQQAATTTTMWLAHEAFRRGWDVAFVDYLELTCGPGALVRGRTRVPDVPREASRERYAAALRGGQVRAEVRDLGAEDVVFLRNNPADRFSSWAERVGNPAVAFGRLLRAHGVRVVNDPDGLERARHPAYLLERVPHLLPPTVMSRDADELEAFLRGLDGPAVLKPVGGYGGHGVFYVARRDRANVRAMIEVLAQSGYVAAQQYVPEAAHGDKRVLLWQGEPLALGGDRWSAYLRRAARGERRNNIHAGGHRRGCGLSERERAICAEIGAHLRADGLALVGLDLVGERILEVNVFAPGGMHNMHALYGANVAARVIDELAREARPRA